MRETIKLISEIGKNPVVTRHTDKTFKKELGRATTAMLQFMQNKAGIDENVVVQRMEDLRDLMDDSLFHKEKELAGSSRKSVQMSARNVRKTMQMRRTTM